MTNGVFCVPNWNAFSSGANVYNRNLWSELHDRFPHQYELVHKPEDLGEDEPDALVLDSLFLDSLPGRFFRNASIILLGHSLKNYRPDIYSPRVLDEEQRLFRLLNGIICSGQPALERCRALIGDRDCFLIKPGLSKPAVDQVKQFNPNRPLRIIITANLVREKDVMTFLKRTREYVSSRGIDYPVELTLIGDRRLQPEYAAQCMELISALDTEQWLVDYMEPMKRKRYLKLLSRADLYVHPALFESYGMSIVEAAQRGIPVLCLDAANAAGAVEDGQNGFVCESIDQLLDRWWKLMTLVSEEEKWPFRAVPDIELPSWDEQAVRLHEIVLSRIGDA